MALLSPIVLLVVFGSALGDFMVSDIGVGVSVMVLQSRATELGGIGS